MTDLPVQRCDSCGHEWWGASRRDALQAGWKWHLGKHGVSFAMCDSCEAHYQTIWLARRQQRLAAKAG